MAGCDSQAVVAVDALSKRFGAVRALEDVSLRLAGGEVHGIVGENGAGKSTLMGILAGLHEPSEGRVTQFGREVTDFRPAAAIRRGVAMVHQELSPVADMTVAENIFLGREPVRLGLVRKGRMNRQARELLDRVGCPAGPTEKLGRLSVAGQQMVEIAKAMSLRARVFIFDEPTAVLSRPEAERLFALIGRLKAEGCCVLYISHLLDEVLRVCDKVTVMRDGRVVRTLSPGDLPPGLAGQRDLAGLMVGRRLADHFPPRNDPGDEVRLTVRALAAPPAVREAELSIRAGEIVGLAGLVGAGRTELAEAIAGLRRRAGGWVTVAGRTVRPDRPAAALAAGLAYLSEDRRGRGLIIGRPIAENLTLASLRQFARVFVTRRAEKARSSEQVRRLGIKLGRLSDPIETLSGGNQQKVALGKWLATEPKVLLLDEPTRGVDIGAKEEIYRLIHRLAESGLACLMISSEINELLGMCHRIAVMRSGRIAAELEGDDMTERKIMYHAAGVEAAPA